MTSHPFARTSARSGETEQIVVTIYNMHKWSFIPYCRLRETFRTNFNAHCYGQLISHVHASIVQYMSSTDESVRSTAYQQYMHGIVYLWFICLLLIVCGCTLLPLFYVHQFIGATILVLAITFCCNGLCICGLFWCTLKIRGLIKRYKYMIACSICDGMHDLNQWYSNVASFELIDIISIVSLYQRTVDLSIVIQITLLATNEIPNLENPLLPRDDAAPMKCVERNYIASDIDHGVRLPLTPAPSLRPVKASNMGSRVHVDVDNEPENKERENEAKLIEMFHSTQTHRDIEALIEAHNNEECDPQLNYYNIGKQIFHYLNGGLQDDNVVVVVSTRNKQPQISYVSQSTDYELRLNDICGKDVFAYRAMNGCESHDYANNFKETVLELSKMPNNHTLQIARTLDYMFGAGCHVAQATHQDFNVFCRYSDELIARVELANGTYIIAWRR